MTKNKITSACALLVATLLVSFVAYAQSASPQETLAQYIADLQKTPNDNALREKIIKHVQTMKKPPAIPEEARRHYVKAITLLEDARQPSDSADAAEEFRKALLVAPWWGDAYMKLGLALETAQRYDDAIVALKLYMTTKPRGEVLRKAQDEIYKIEAKRDRAEKDKESAAKKAEEDRRVQAEEAVRAQQRRIDEFYRKCDGRRYVLDFGDSENTADLRGRQIILGSIYKSGRPDEIPSNMQLGVWKEMWDLNISNMVLEGGMLVLTFDGSNNNWMYGKAYLNEFCEIKFVQKLEGARETNYYRPRGR